MFQTCANQNTPTNDWLIHNVHRMDANDRYVLSRVTSFALTGPFALLSSAYHGVCLLSKLPFSAAKFVVRIIPCVGYSLASYFPEGLNLRDLLSHAYKVVCFVFSAGASPFLGLVSPRSLVQMHLMFGLFRLPPEQKPIHMVFENENLLPVEKKEDEAIHLSLPSALGHSFLQSPNSIPNSEETINPTKTLNALPQDPPNFAPKSSSSLMGIFSRLFYNRSSPSEVKDSKKEISKPVFKYENLKWPAYIDAYQLPSSCSPKNLNNKKNGTEKDRQFGDVLGELAQAQGNIFQRNHLINMLTSGSETFEEYVSLKARLEKIKQDLSKIAPLKMHNISKRAIFDDKKFAIPLPPPPPPLPTTGNPPPPPPLPPTTFSGSKENLEMESVSQIEKKSDSVLLVAERQKVLKSLNVAKKKLEELIFDEKDRTEELSENVLEWTFKRFHYLLEQRIHQISQQKKKAVSKLSAKPHPTPNTEGLLREELEMIHILETAWKNIKSNRQNLANISQYIPKKTLLLSSKTKRLNSLALDCTSLLNESDAKEFEELNDEVDRLDKDVKEMQRKQDNYLEVIKKEVSILQKYLKTNVSDFDRLEKMVEEKIAQLKIEGKEKAVSRRQVKSNSDPIVSRRLVAKKPHNSVIRSEKYFIEEFYANKIAEIEKRFKIEKPMIKKMILQEEIEGLKNMLLKQDADQTIEKDLVLKQKELEHFDELIKMRDEIFDCHHSDFHYRWESCAKDYAQKKLDCQGL